MRHQGGFTLLELMVAMSIFAMLAVAGWQVFDGVNRARERAQYQADNLAVLQYVYLQIQQDMGQVIPYQAPSIQNGSDDTNSTPTLNANNNQQSSTQQSNAKADSKQASFAKPFMSVSNDSISFVRFADPDPRYQSSPSIQRIDYVFDNQQLIRRQYTSIDDDPSNISLDSVLLTEISEGRLQAYLPELSTTFPNSDTQNSTSDATAIKNPLLPKGIGISFTYQDVPITWQFALNSQ